MGLETGLEGREQAEIEVLAEIQDRWIHVEPVKRSIQSFLLTELPRLPFFSGTLVQQRLYQECAIGIPCFSRVFQACYFSMLNAKQAFQSTFSYARLEFGETQATTPVT